MHVIFSAIAATAAVTLLTLAAVSLVVSDVRFWPPPAKGSWQDVSFIWLFRAMVYGLVGASLLAIFLDGRVPATSALVAGGLLVLFGFGGAFASTRNLGWRNAFGDREGLITEGWFAYSRNPVYVTTWVGLAGWALLVPDLAVRLILLGWGLLYVLATRLEEPWLEAEYGEAYRSYRRRVPRFLLIRDRAAREET